jgi:hypothetical protein
MQVSLRLLHVDFFIFDLDWKGRRSCFKFKSNSDRLRRVSKHDVVKSLTAFSNQITNFRSHSSISCSESDESMEGSSEDESKISNSSRTLSEYLSSSIMS